MSGVHGLTSAARLQGQAQPEHVPGFASRSAQQRAACSQARSSARCNCSPAARRRSNGISSVLASCSSTASCRRAAPGGSHSRRSDHLEGRLRHAAAMGGIQPASTRCSCCEKPAMSECSRMYAPCTWVAAARWPGRAAHRAARASIAGRPRPGSSRRRPGRTGASRSPPPAAPGRHPRRSAASARATETSRGSTPPRLARSCSTPSRSAALLTCMRCRPSAANTARAPAGRRR